MKIHLLDLDVVKKLRSDLSFVSVSHCVEELVWNSIDAGSTCIAVRLNLPFYKIQVVDNGNGIPPDQMALVGKRYATSKCHSLEDLQNLQYGGFRGEALSSLKDIASNLMIESRASGCETTYCKIFNYGKAGSPTVSINPRPSKGTTVTVFDFMYNRPVRKNAISEAIDVEDTCKLVQSIALVHADISFSLLNETTGEMCLQFRKCTSSYFAFMQLFGKEKAKNLKPCDHREDDYKISGYISTDCFPSKNYQFLYVNNRITLKTRLHKLINNLLNKVFGGKNKHECNASVLPSPQMLSPSRNQYCCFILNISCPRNVYDTIFDRKRTMVEFSDWDKVTKLVQDAVVNFLSAEGLISDLPGETDNLILKEIDTDNPNSRFLNLGVDNFRNGLFSNPVKRLMKAAEVTKISDEELLNKQVNSKECIQSQCNPQNEINSQNLETTKNVVDTLLFNGLSSLDTESGCHGSQTIIHGKTFQKKNLICLKDTETSVFDRLRKINNNLKISDSKTNECSSISSLTSAFESHSDIPCRSIFPTQNPIMLTVPMKSTLSLLEKEGKGSDTLQKLKEKYLFMPKKSKLISGTSEKLVTPSSKANVIWNSNLKSNINLDKSSLLDNEVNKNITKESASPNSALAVDKNNSRKTSKYTFHEETVLSPFKRLRRAKNSNVKTQMLPVDESSSNESKSVVNNISNKTEFVLDSKVHNSPKSHFKEKNVEISCLQNLQTFHNEIDSNMTTKKKNLFDSEYQNHIDNNPAPSFLQFDNPNPFLKIYCSSKEINTRFCDSEEIIYDCVKNNPPLKNFRDCTETSISPPDMFLNDKSPHEVTNSKFLSRILTTKQFLQDSKTLKANNKTVFEKSHIIKLQSNLENSDDFTKLTRLNPDVSDDCDFLKSASSGELDFFHKKNYTIQNIPNELWFNPPQYAMKSSSAISYDDFQQDSKTLKNAPLMNCDTLTANISSENSSPSVNLSESFSPSVNSSVVIDANLNIGEKSLTSLSLSHQFESVKHSFIISPENLSIIDSPSRFQMNGEMNVAFERGAYSCAVSDMSGTSSSPRSSIIIDQDAPKPSVCDPDENKMKFSTKDQNVLNKQLISPTRFLNKTSKYNQKEYLQLANTPFNLISDFQSIGEEFTSEHKTEEYVNDGNDLINTSSVSNSQCVDEKFTSEHKTEEHVDGGNEPINMSSLRDEVNISISNNNQANTSFINCSPCGTEKSFPKNNLESIREQSAFCEPAQSKPEGNRWICKLNENTKQVAYIDSVTGNSTYFPPGSPEIEKARISANKDSDCGPSKKAHFFLTHDFSPFVSEFLSSKELPDVTDEICDLQIDLDNHIEKVENNDWRKKWRYPVKEVEITDNSGNIQNMFKEWENPMFQNPPEVNSLEKTQVSMCVPHMYFLNSYRFTQNCFNNLKVIGQVDCKFIACIMEDLSNNTKNEKLLILFDQHAVHERVRLEELFEDLYEVKENKKVVKTVPISPSLDVTLEPDEMRLLRSYHLSLRDIGFEINFPGDDNIVCVSSLPSCLANQTNNQPRKRIPEAATLVEKIIKEWLNSVMQTRSTSSVLPKTLNAVLNSQACRGAVKFGDPLDLSQCELLLDALSTCKLPFQCAHGRPSIAPILDLNKIKSLNKKRATPKLWKLHKVLENQ
ncbi:DNA mismatch repair protein Mlh3 [Araneus ventricosus]|uniref:DNA mismatch repair protein Mlh3 n=1 Tax=Araneus ventricosus TaxID=182803 RepID=A0A4Y2BZI7_ARAVE|nr:DNA mismatch repair protein Mlh3 [Araneus ventricosus]